MSKTDKYIVAIVVVIGLVLFLLLNNSTKRFYGESYRKEVVNFSLTDHNGNKFQLSEHKGKIVLVNFGFTACPDICPTTLGRLANVLLKMENYSDSIEVLFITVDPERDTVAKLGEFIPYFHKKILGLTGSKEEISNVASIFNVVYLKEDEKSNGDYLMSHSPSIYLINKKGKLILKYSQGNMEPEGITSDINKLLM